MHWAIPRREVTRIDLELYDDVEFRELDDGSLEIRGVTVDTRASFKLVLGPPAPADRQCRDGRPPPHPVEK